MPKPQRNSQQKATANKRDRTSRKTKTQEAKQLHAGPLDKEIQEVIDAIEKLTDEINDINNKIEDKRQLLNVYVVDLAKWVEGKPANSQLVDEVKKRLAEASHFLHSEGKYAQISN